VGKAGKETYGLGRFFSSLQNRVIPSIAFFVFSLVDVQERQSYPLQVAQIVRTGGELGQQKKEKLPKAEKRPKGRPKGSRNKKSEKPTLSFELLRIQTILQAFLNVLIGSLPVQYLVMDGHFGNYPSAWMVLQSGLQFISKLRWDAALYEPIPWPRAAPKIWRPSECLPHEEEIFEERQNGRRSSHPDLPSVPAQQGICLSVTGRCDSQNGS
jgi:putative transposase